MNIRKVKRFIGTRKISRYEVITQYLDDNGKWVDFPTDAEAEWESYDDESQYDYAVEYEANHQAR